MSQFNYNITCIGKLKGVTFAHLNCRSILKELPEINIFFNDMDFLMCSETWLDERYSNDMIKLNGKTCFRLDREHINDNCNKIGGGVAIYVGNSRKMFVTIDNTFSYADLEIITLQIDKPAHRKMTISCVYRPPKSNQDSTYRLLSSVLDRLNTSNNEIWIGGDFNLDWNRRNHDQLKKIKNLLRTYNLHQLIKGVMRPLCMGGTCIDWLVTNSNFVASSGITNDLISDHLTIFAVKKV